MVFGFILQIEILGRVWEYNRVIRFGVWTVDTSGSGWELAMDACEVGNETLCPVNGLKFLLTG